MLKDKATARTVKVILYYTDVEFMLTGSLDRHSEHIAANSVTYATPAAPPPGLKQSIVALTQPNGVNTA